MALDNLEKLLQGLQAWDGHKEFLDIVDANAPVLSMLQQDQLSEGKDNTGQVRSDDYRPFTIAYKRMFGIGLGAITDRVTFFMTGQLYDSLTTRITGDNFLVQSPLPTFNKMIERVGDDNYGLDEQRRIDFATNTAMPLYRERFKEVTGLTMRKV